MAEEDDNEVTYQFIGPARDPHRLIELLQTHKANQHGVDRNSLVRVLEMFWENAEELHKWMAVYENPKTAFFLTHRGGWEEPGDLMTGYTDELYRLWFNYSASATAAIEHANQIAKASREDFPAFWNKHQRFRTLVRGTEIEAVTVGLRNIFLHSGWPNFKFRFDLGPQEDHGLFCDPQVLLDSNDKWRDEARVHLQNLIDAGEVFSLRDAMEEFSARIDQYYEEFWKAHTEEHLDTLRDLTHLHAEYDANWGVDERPLREQIGSFTLDEED